MPSKDPSNQEKGFRTSMLGFDKNDVLAYMNALANETQQRELEYQQTIDELNAQLDKLKKDQANARRCVEKLQAELNQATQRAETAEKAGSDAVTKLRDAEERASAYQGKYKECQQSILELQFQKRDLEKQVEEMEAMIPKGGMPAPAPAPAPVAPAPEPVKPAKQEEPAPAPAPVNVTEQARIEAKKILADARLNAESAERRLRQQEDDQKARMADNARALAAGVQLLRDRLTRVDEKLASASMDLENATGAIYQALDDTSSDLESLGADMRSFGKLRPAQPSAEPQAQTPAQPVQPVQPARAKVSPRRVRPVRSQPEPEPVKRLRRTSAPPRPVSEELGDAIERLDKRSK
nr:hypothetical protein [uncultured Gemmiger sp.]